LVVGCQQGKVDNLCSLSQIFKKKAQTSFIVLEILNVLLFNDQHEDNRWFYHNDVD
jgi:hypothetical protein